MKEKIEKLREAVCRVDSSWASRGLAVWLAFMLITAGLGGIALVDPDYSAVGEASSDAADVVQVSAVTTGMTDPTGVATSGNYIYAADTAGQIEIINASDPSTPTHVKSVTTTIASPYKAAAAGNLLVLGDADGTTGGNETIEIYDISDPENPVHKATKTISTGGGRVTALRFSESDNTVLFTARYANPIRAIDLTTPSSPTVLDSINPDTSNGATDIYQLAFYKGYLYGSANSYTKDGVVINATDPSMMTREPDFATVGNPIPRAAWVDQETGMLFLGDTTRVTRYSLSDPSAPAKKDYVNQPVENSNDIVGISGGDSILTSESTTPSTDVLGRNPFAKAQDLQTVDTHQKDVFIQGGEFYFVAGEQNGAVRIYSTNEFDTQPVSGTVTDSDGDPISGATVETGSKSTTTASDGSYTLHLIDGTHTITASQAGYVSKSQTVTVSGAPVSGVDYTLLGQLRGHVRNGEADNSPISGATVETSGGTSDTTNATGFYSLPIIDGNYKVTADHPDFTAFQDDISVVGSTRYNYTLCQSGCASSGSKVGSYAQTFILEDYTGEFYGNDPHLIAYRFVGDDISDAEPIVSDGDHTEDWEYVDILGFNHANESFHTLLNDTYYNFLVIQGEKVDLAQTDGVYETGPYLAHKDNDPRTLQIGRPTNETNSSDPCQIFTSDDNGLEVICSGENPIRNFDFNISRPDGSIYNGSISFDGPKDYYEGELPQEILTNYTNSTSAAEEVVIDYSGTYGNGSSFNGTGTLWGSTGGGSQSFSFGPVGSGGGGDGGDASQIGGFLLLAGGAAVAYRRWGNGGLERSAASAVKSAGEAVSRLRGR